MFGLGIFEMLIVGAIAAVMLAGGIAVIVVVITSMKRGGPNFEQRQALEQENRRMREKDAKFKGRSS